MVRCVMDLPGDDHQGEGMIHLIFGGCFVNGQPAGFQDAFERMRAERPCRDREKGTDRTDHHEEDRRLVHHSPSRLFQTCRHLQARIVAWLKIRADMNLKASRAFARPGTLEE